MVVISAGIRPRDELARDCGLEVGLRGGVVVDDTLRTSDPDILAIGEVASHRGMVYGLVAPGYEMADVAAANLTARSRTFSGFDMSTKLKLMGVDVASFGDPFADGRGSAGARLRRPVRGRLQEARLQPRRDPAAGRRSGRRRLRLRHAARAVQERKAARRFLPARSPVGRCDRGLRRSELDAQVCSCNNVGERQIREAVREQKLTTVAQVKSLHPGRHRLRRLPAARHRAAQGRAQGDGCAGRQPALRALPH